MNSHQSNKKNSLPIFWLVMLVSILGFLLALAFPPERKEVDKSHLPWNAKFTPNGDLHALGLTINKSTVADSMKLYGKDLEVKIFSDSDESNKSVEAYFPAIYIGSIKAALTLKLNIDPQTLNQFFEGGKRITTTTSGDRVVELYTSEVGKLLNNTFSSITLVPRNHLTERAISTRFGKPDRAEIQSDNLSHLFFYKLGLEMIIDEEGPEALQYTTNPPEN